MTFPWGFNRLIAWISLRLLTWSILKSKKKEHSSCNVHQVKKHRPFTYDSTQFSENTRNQRAYSDQTGLTFSPFIPLFHLLASKIIPISNVLNFKDFRESSLSFLPEDTVFFRRKRKPSLHILRNKHALRTP